MAETVWDRLRKRVLPEVEPERVTIDMRRIYVALPVSLIEQLDGIADRNVVSRRLLIEKVLTDFAIHHRGTSLPLTEGPPE